MTDPRIGLGYDVENDIVGPFELTQTNSGDGGSLDRGIIARTLSGDQVVIGEIWAACPGKATRKVRIDSVNIARKIVDALNRGYHE